jgi:hypothetical protein
MKLESYRSDYYAFSTKASELCRQLSFAGIAVIWIFKNEDGGPLAVPAALLIPALGFCVSLALDLLHAAVGTLIWGAFARHHERHGVGDTAEVTAPAWLNWPSLVFFWGKVGTTIVSYLFLARYVLSLA